MGLYKKMQLNAQQNGKSRLSAQHIMCFRASLIEFVHNLCCFFLSAYIFLSYTHSFRCMHMVGMLLAISAPSSRTCVTGRESVHMLLIVCVRACVRAVGMLQQCDRFLTASPYVCVSVCVRVCIRWTRENIRSG